MKSTKKIVLDLLGGTIQPSIKAKQNDKNSRYIEAFLYSGSEIFTPESGALFAFRYKKPDGTAGFYDALPDNSPAITVSGNAIAVEIVEQVLTVAGCVQCEINIYNAASEKLTTFTFEIVVEKSVLTDAEIISSNYYNVLTAQVSAALQYKNEATASAAEAAESASEAAMTLASSVKSINEKTPNASGAVTLTPSDIGALTTDGDGSNVTAAFTEAAQDADIQTGEKLSVLFGKIKKRLSMLKSIASNPNLLDNGNFVQRVNQRGVSGTIATAGYFIDRWKLVSGSVTLSADGLQLAAGTVIAQILEYAAGTEVIASLGITSGTVSAAYDNATKTYIITATTACTLTWAKLEKGSIATPYVPKGYGAELAECRRCYYSFPFQYCAVHVQPASYPTVVPVQFPVTMRISPTIKFAKQWDSGVTSISSEYVSTGGCGISINAATGALMDVHYTVNASADM